MLLADVLRYGRVLVDRDEDWGGLKRREWLIVSRAGAEEDRQQRLAWGAPDALEEVARGLTVRSP